MKLTLALTILCFTLTSPSSPLEERNVRRSIVEEKDAILKLHDMTKGEDNSKNEEEEETNNSDEDEDEDDDDDDDEKRLVEQRRNIKYRICINNYDSVESVVLIASLTVIACLLVLMTCL